MHCRRGRRFGAKFSLHTLSLPHDHACHDWGLTRLARSVAAHDQPRASLDVAAPLLARSEGECPAPYLRFARGCVVGPDATAERRDEGRRADDDHVGNGDRLSGSDAHFHLAAYAPRRVDPFASHLRPRRPAILLRPLRMGRIFMPERHRARKHDE